MDYTSKFKFGDAEDEQPSSTEPTAKQQDQDNAQYATPGHIRNICFVQEDGSWDFFNYAYLVNAKYSLIENSLNLYFTSHTVTLRGTRLSELGLEIMDQITKQVSVVNERYRNISNPKTPVIFSLKIEEKR